MVVEVGPEIEQLVFEICRRPEQQVIQILRRRVPFCCDSRYVAFVQITQQLELLVRARTPHN
jgi:hypothetical protein